MTVSIQDAKMAYRSAKIIALLMMNAILLYGMIGYTVSKNQTAVVFPNPQTTQLFFYGGFMLSVGLYWGAKQLAQFLLKRQRWDGHIASESRDLRFLLSISIFVCATAEIPAVLGLVFVFLNRNFSVYFPFGILSLTLLALSFPRKEQWIKWTHVDF